MKFTSQFITTVGSVDILVWTAGCVVTDWPAEAGSRRRWGRWPCGLGHALSGRLEEVWVLASSPRCTGWLPATGEKTTWRLLLGPLNGSGLFNFERNVRTYRLRQGDAIDLNSRHLFHRVKNFMLVWKLKNMILYETTLGCPKLFIYGNV